MKTQRKTYNIYSVRPDAKRVASPCEIAAMIKAREEAEQ